MTIGEALDAAGGYRSILGIAKHVAGWSAVYHSYAFERSPRGWDEIDWPRGLRDRIEPTDAYLVEVVEWFRRTSRAWLDSVSDVGDLGGRRPVHWGGDEPLVDIAASVATHWAYHAGEINEILALRRREAWEVSEEVEENHISTVGHRVRPPWMTDEGNDQGNT